MFHNLATKNKFRKSGIGSALTLYMMNEAKKSGFTHGFLDSSDEGFNLYSKLGFKVYCVTSVYERS
jgi:ribosomal protein S18 acetylase RimI-like enzyme